MKKKTGLKALMITVFAMLFTIRVNAEVLIKAEIPIEADNGAVVEITTDENAPMPEQSRITIGSSGKGSFEIPFEEPGDYHYTITRTDRSNFDAYRILISITRNEDGSYRSVVIVTGSKDQEKYSSVRFVTPPAPPSSSTPQVIQQQTDAPVPSVTLIANTGDAFHVEKEVAVLAAALAAAGFAIYKLQDNKNE